MSVPRFVVPSPMLGGSVAELTGAELHHLRVRRLGAGDPVLLIDGNGGERGGVVESLTRTRALVRLSPRAVPAPSEEVTINLLLALIKPDRLELALEKTTELGVSRITLFQSERTVGSASEARLSRWRRIIAGAAKQCGRSDFPALEGPLAFAEALRARADELRLFIWENAQRRATLASLDTPRPASVCLMIGPEGGFSPAEASECLAAGLIPVSLGKYILRSETAAIVAVGLAHNRWV